MRIRVSSALLFRTIIFGLVVACIVPLVYATMNLAEYRLHEMRLDAAFSEVAFTPEQSEGERDASVTQPPSIATTLFDFFGVLLACATASVLGWKRAAIPHARVLALFLCAYAFMEGPTLAFFLRGGMRPEVVAALTLGATCVAVGAFYRFSCLFPRPLSRDEVIANSMSGLRLWSRSPHTTPRSARIASLLSRSSPHRTDRRLMLALFGTYWLILTILLTILLAIIAGIAELLVGKIPDPSGSSPLGIWLLRIQTGVAVAVAVVVAAEIVAAVLRRSRGLSLGAKARLWAAYIAAGALAYAFSRNVMFMTAGLLVVGLAERSPAAWERQSDRWMILLVSSTLAAPWMEVQVFAPALLWVLLRKRYFRPLLPERLRSSAPHPFRRLRVAMMRPIVLWPVILGVCALIMAVFIYRPGSGIASGLTDFILPAAFLTIVSGVRNLRLGYALTEGNDRLKVLWIVNGFVTSLLLLILFPVIAVAAVPEHAMDAVGEMYLPLVFLIISGSVFVAVFYHGAIDPQLVLNRTSVYGVIGVLAVVVFAGVENLLEDQVIRWLEVPKPAIPWIASGTVALAFLPLHKWVEPRLERVVGRFFPRPLVVTDDGEAVLVLADIVDFTELSQADGNAAARVASVLRLVGKEVAFRHGGRVAEAVRDTVLLELPSAEAGVPAARQILRDFAAATRKLDWPQVSVRAAVHGGRVVRGHDGALHGAVMLELERLYRLADAGTVLVSSAVMAETRDGFTELTPPQEGGAFPAALQVWSIGAAA